MQGQSNYEEIYIKQSVNLAPDKKCRSQASIVLIMLTTCILIQRRDFRPIHLFYAEKLPLILSRENRIK